MGDAIPKVHAFFKQHKRKADFKGADVAPNGNRNINNTNINQADGVAPINTDNDGNNTNAEPSTMEGLPNVATPTPTLPTELGNELGN